MLNPKQLILELSQIGDTAVVQAIPSLGHDVRYFSLHTGVSHDDAWLPPIVILHGLMAHHTSLPPPPHCNLGCLTGIILPRTHVMSQAASLADPIGRSLRACCQH